MGFPAAFDAAGAQLPSQRIGAARAHRCRDSRLLGHPGEAARGVPQGRIDPRPRQYSDAILLRTAGAALDRQRAGPCQFRPDTAQLACADLGMDQPRPVADHGARLQCADERPDRRRQAARGEPGSGGVPDQGRQIPGKRPQLTRRRRAEPRQALGLYRVTNGL